MAYIPASEITARLARSVLAGVLVATVGLGCVADPGPEFPAGAPPGPGSNLGPGGGDEGGGGGCSTADVINTVFAVSCTGGGCHDAQEPKAGLDLASAGVEARLADSAARQCNNKVLVSPGNAAGSYLLDKLQGDASCGAPMPLGGAPLSATAINCVADWIDGMATGGGSNPGTGSGPGGGNGGGGDPPPPMGW